MKSNFVNANRFRSPKGAITYNIVKTDHGYTIQAFIPKQTSTSDKSKIIEWFRDYRNRIRQENPFISARFYNHDNGYSLEIKPCTSCRPIDEDGERVKGILDDSFRNA
ncbi:MAG TPA: hypothetical protein VNW97_13105 [Candidatus Saccharimonadales bacterium]|nr:hypothetical protein [Candidatus Saccharimonadales bacterium]